MRQSRLARAALGATLLLSAACRTTSTPLPSATADPAGRLWVVLINGGHDRALNYQSHFLHLQQLLAEVRRAGIPPERIAVFASDGESPDPDLATREMQPEPDFWLIRDTRLGGLLRTPIVYGNSHIDGVTIRPATKAAILQWFAGPGRTLRPGDTLLFYVTDHGTKNAQDLRNNRITLWGPDESLAVNDLGAFLKILDPRVRVVLLMSQCFSGSFANLLRANPADPSAGVCGYFSTTPDRPAYGCYPENRGRDNVGHSFHFIGALANTGRFTDAHRDVMVSDDAPDVPLRTSDRYLDDLLRRASGSDGDAYDRFVDAQLRIAWQDKATWEPDIRLLDRIANAYGMFSPRSLAEVDEQAGQLPALSEQLKGYGKAWRNGFADSTGANLGRFLAAQPGWATHLQPKSLEALPEAERRATTAGLLAGLGPYTRRDRATLKRLQHLDARADAADAAAYRMEVRLGVVLRLRAILINVAGRTYLATHGTAKERASYDALVACEDLRLPLEGATGSPQAASHPAFPTLADDVRGMRDVVPAWMGINFRDATEAQRAEHSLPEGAAGVVAVYPDSPAEAAGLLPGDVVLGPPGTPFTERNQIRVWTLLASIDTPAPLVVLRDGSPRTITLTPRAFPMKWPSLPGPIQVGDAAPAAKLSAYRGSVPPTLADGSTHVLFFWATWCGPCKASLPALLEYEQRTGARVIAVTDENPATLDTFFTAFTAPFPATVAVDVDRRTFQAFGVSGTPTFVVVDGGGTVRAAVTGYDVAKGLRLEPPTTTGRHP